MYRLEMVSNLIKIASILEALGWETTAKIVKTYAGFGPMATTKQIIFRKDNQSFDIIALYEPHYGHNNEWALEAYWHGEDRDVINYYHDNDILHFIKELIEYIKY